MTLTTKVNALFVKMIQDSWVHAIFANNVIIKSVPRWSKTFAPI